MTEYRCPSDIELEQKLERQEEKKKYDYEHYKRPEVMHRKKARAKALLKLSHKYPREFKKLLKKEQEK